MITVDKFLCFNLETGGLVIGWSYFILESLSAIIGWYAVILVSVAECSELGKESHNPFNIDDEQRNCAINRGILIGLLMFLIATALGIAAFAWSCIKGTKARNHILVKPMLIVLAIFPVMSLFEICTLDMKIIIHGLVSAAINGYCFVVIYSLYDLFKRGNESNVITQQKQLEKV